MRLRRRQLSVSGAVLAGLIIAAAPTANAVNTPPPKTITGVVQTIIREQPRGHHADANDTFKVLRVGTKTVPLTDGSLTSTKDGATVAVTVAPAADGTQSVLSATTISAPVAAAISPTHQVHVALVRPLGVPSDATITDASARAMVNTVSQYWSSQTGALVSFNTAQVLAYDSAFACGATSSMWTEALNKMPAASGAGQHLVVVAPAGADTTYGCDYGLGSIGAVEASGNKVFVSGLGQSLLAHELGHNLGLYHSNALRCGTVQDLPKVGTAFPGCTPRPYDDLFDVMGYSGPSFGEGNLNAVHLDGMNLLPGAVRKIAANSGVTTAQLTPLSTTTNNRTLKITDPSGANYFVEYRTNSGRDVAANLNSYYAPAWGVRVLRDDPAEPASGGSYEMDASPTSVSNDYNRSLPVGATFTAASNKLTIKVTAADANSATVTITNGTPVVVKKSTWAYVASSRSGSAVSISALIKTTNLQTIVPSVGRTVYLQRYLNGSWQSMLSRTSSSTGRFTVGFIQTKVFQYRLVVTETSTAKGAYSASTFR